MSTIQNLFHQAQLAEAAYADFFSNAGVLLTNNNDIKAALITEGMSGAQANVFVAEWEVVDQFSASGGLLGDGSGFSGTLFQNKAGQYSLALRGTAGATDLMADAGDILTDGIALDQVVDMYNYWQCLTHIGTYEAVQLNTLTAETVALRSAYGISTAVGLAYEATLRASGLIIDNPSLTVRTLQWVDSTQLSNAKLQAGSGKLPVTAVMNVDGHSLGGHLAMTFSRLFPSATNSVTAINGAGFNFTNTNTDALFTALRGTSGFDAGKITNIVGSAAMAMVAQDWLFLQQPAGRQEIYTESYAISTTVGHGSGQMTDSMALYNLFATLDPSLSMTSGISKITTLLNSSSNVNTSSLENALDALRKTLLGVTDTTAIDNRDSFYSNLLALQNSAEYQSLTNSATIRVLAESDAASMASRAKTDFGDFLALAYLSPFAIEGSWAVLSTTHTDLYSQYQDDQSLTKPTRSNKWCLQIVRALCGM